MTVAPETLLGSHLWGVMGPPMGRPQPLLLLPPLLARQLTKSAWGGQGEGMREGNGMAAGEGIPFPSLPPRPQPRHCLDVAQINSPPISSWPNLKPDQTRNSAAGEVEPSLMPHKPTPPPQSLSHSQSPITHSRHALWLRGQPEAPKA